MEKLQFVKDGQLQGWVTATALTVWIFFVLVPLAILFERVGKGFVLIGGILATLYLGSLGIFFGARVAQNPKVQEVVTKIFSRAGKTSLAQPQKDKCEEERRADHVEED